MEENIAINKKIRFVKIIVSIILISILPIYYIYSTYFIDNEEISDSKIRKINVFNKCTINVPFDWNIKDEINEKYILINNNNLSGYIYCEDYKTKNIFESVSLNTNEDQLISDNWNKVKEINNTKVINLRILKIKEKQYEKQNQKKYQVIYVYPVDKEFNLIFTLQYDDINKYNEDKKYIIGSFSSLTVIDELSFNENIILPIDKNGSMYVDLIKYNVKAGITYNDKYKQVEAREYDSMRFESYNSNDTIVTNVSLIAMEKYEYLRTIIEKYEMNPDIEYIKDIDIYKEKSFEKNGNDFSYITIKYIDKVTKKKKESVYVICEIRPTMLYAIEILNQVRNTNIEQIMEFTDVSIYK